MPPLLGAIEPVPIGIIAWVSVGLICGLISGSSLKGNRFGMIGDLVFAVIGALIGAAPIGFLARNPEGFFGSILVAFVGACVFIALSRALFGHRTG